MIKKVAYLFVLVFCNITIKAQDPHFSQFYAAPMYLNPAFAGAITEHRLAINYRNQWPGISKAFTSYNAAYDYNMYELNSGVGLSFLSDKAGSAGLKTNTINGFYSYQIKFSRFNQFRIGANLSYNQISIDHSQLVFNDQLYTGSSTSIESNSFLRKSYFNASTGALLTTPENWLGISFSNIIKPNQTLIDLSSPLPMKISLHGGWKLGVSKKRNIVRRYYTLSFNYKHQNKFDQLDIGGYIYFMQINAGLWYRGLPMKKYGPEFTNNESFIFMLGYEIKEMDLRIGYSYDITTSRLSTNTAGAHEISIIYEMAQPTKKRNKRIQVSCPKF